MIGNFDFLLLFPVEIETYTFRIIFIHNKVMKFEKGIIIHVIVITVAEQSIFSRKKIFHADISTTSSIDMFI